MIVRSIDDLHGTEREVHAPTWVSRRFLLRKDGMGFSFHETIIHAGTETYMWYRNHLEAVYCVEGEGELEEAVNGKKHSIKPGTMYALDQHDRHIVRAKTSLRLLCVFNPPCTGKEVHDKEGVYPLMIDGEEEIAAADSAAAVENRETRMATMNDIYPTRSANEISLMDRQDPVVYSHNGSAMGPLTHPQLEQYERDGFLFLEDFFAPDEVEAMQKELHALRQSEEAAQNGCTIIEPASQEVRSVFDVTRLSHLFWMLSRDSRLVDMIRQILDDNLYIHQSRINYKPGFRGKEFYWHSDFETWHAEDGMPRMRAVSCSIALTENNQLNGPLMVIPGSHQYFVSCAGETPKDHYKDSLRKQEYGVPDESSLAALAERGGIVAPTGPAGSVLLFECNIMHGSNGNISPYPRSNVFLVYNAVSNALVEPYQSEHPRPNFVASRDFAPITPVDSESLVASMEALQA